MKHEEIWLILSYLRLQQAHALSRQDRVFRQRPDFEIRSTATLRSVPLISIDLQKCSEQLVSIDHDTIKTLSSPSRTAC